MLACLPPGAGSCWFLIEAVVEVTSKAFPFAGSCSARPWSRRRTMSRKWSLAYVRNMMPSTQSSHEYDTNPPPRAGHTLGVDRLVFVGASCMPFGKVFRLASSPLLALPSLYTWNRKGGQGGRRTCTVACSGVRKSSGLLKQTNGFCFRMHVGKDTPVFQPN